MKTDSNYSYRQWTNQKGGGLGRALAKRHIFTVTWIFLLANVEVSCPREGLCHNTQVLEGLIVAPLSHFSGCSEDDHAVASS